MMLQFIPLSCLEPHPANSNAMSAALQAKLRAHLKRSGRYPPLIVRPMPQRVGAGAPRHQILDGHCRAAILRELGHAGAWCVVWQVDDAEALLLLATLNRLRGDDDPRRRAALLKQVLSNPRSADSPPCLPAGRPGRPEQKKQMATRGIRERRFRGLPESAGRIGRLLKLNEPPPSPAPPRAVADLPTPVHFFLLPADKKRLDAHLKHLGGRREEALMRLLTGAVGGVSAGAPPAPAGRMPCAKEA